MTRRPLAHWGMLLALVAMWGSAFTLTRVELQAAPSVGVVVTRLALGARCCW